MNIMVINGSARKNGNMATMLNSQIFIAIEINFQCSENKF